MRSWSRVARGTAPACILITRAAIRAPRAAPSGCLCTDPHGPRIPALTGASSVGWARVSSGRRSVCASAEDVSMSTLPVTRCHTALVSMSQRAVPRRRCRGVNRRGRPWVNPRHGRSWTFGVDVTSEVKPRCPPHARTPRRSPRRRQLPRGQSQKHDGSGGDRELLTAEDDCVCRRRGACHRLRSSFTRGLRVPARLRRRPRRRHLRGRCHVQDRRRRPFQVADRRWSSMRSRAAVSVS